MGLVVGAIVGFILLLVGRVGLSLASKEIEGRLDQLSVLVLRLARLRLPTELREALHDQEWLPELHHILARPEARPITRLVQGLRFAFSLLRAAPRVARAAGPVQSRRLDQQGLAVPEDRDQIAHEELDRRLAMFEDRDRIARDLHDLVLQRLFATGLGLEGVVRRITDPTLADQVTQVAEDVDRTIRDVRNSIFSLQEPDQSLRCRLLRMVVDTSSTLGFEPRIGFEGPLDGAVPDSVRFDLLATLRDALSNVAQHAAATLATVDVCVDRAGRELTLVVSDDGVGVPDELARRSGTASIAERADRWRGRCSFEPALGGGSRLVWTVMLPRREATS